MACNNPRRSDTAGKKKMIKDCAGGKENISIFVSWENLNN